MTSPVRIDAEAWGDLRFATLARLLGLADRDHALIKVARIWSWQTEHYTPEAPTYVIDPDIVESALGDGGVVALVRARLAEEVPDGVRMRGTEGRIEWYWALRQKGKKGAAATRARWSERGPQPGPQASERSLAHDSDGVPAGLAEDRPQAGHTAIKRNDDNTRRPAGLAQARPPGVAQPGPLTLSLDLDQRSEEDLFSVGEESPSSRPSGDRDREGDGLTFEEWKARRAPRSAPPVVRGPDSAKPGDGAAAYAAAEQIRGGR